MKAHGDGLSDPQQWPLWVQMSPGVFTLFTTMQPFEDGEDDLAKSWGLSETWFALISILQ